MKPLLSMGLVVALIVALPPAAEAQTPDFRRCTTANVLGGGAFGAEVSQPLFGGAVGWELTPHFAIEATTRWLVPERGANAFSALFTAQVPLTGRTRFVPFVTAGAGVHHAWFDTAEGTLPEFYANRLETDRLLSGTTRSFTDPAFVAGGGFSIFASRHISVRPEVETMLVRSDGKNHFLTSVSVRLAYHFESGHITPVSRAR
jgi:hypothetical protein